MSSSKASAESAAPSHKMAPRPRTHTGSVAAAQAKAHLLSIMDEVHENGIPVILTKRGKPLVQIAPLDPTPASPDIFGCMKGTVKILGDIIGPEPDEWEAMQ